jgi:hypothetical protein
MAIHCRAVKNSLRGTAPLFVTISGSETRIKKKHFLSQALVPESGLESDF